MSLYLLTIPVLFLLGVTLWTVLSWPKVARTNQSFPGKVSVLIPARNEEDRLGECLESVLRQDETVGEILVYDDHSTDGTARVVGAYARRDVRLRPLAPVPLDAGWCGKNFACAQLARAATAEWLLFLDADARLAEGAVRSLLGEALRREQTLFSGWPRLELGGFWERALMPMLNFMVFSIFPAPLSLRFPYPSLGLLHGACVLAHRATYEAVGGHGAVRDQIFEDTRLARLWRRGGRRGLCLDGGDLVSVRMYESLGGIWRGFEKNFYLGFRRETSFWALILCHAIFFLSPFLLLLWSQSRPVTLAAAGVLGIRLLLVLRFRHPWWSALVHPLAEALLIALGLTSWWKCKSGRGVEWKGRQYYPSRS